MSIKITVTICGMPKVLSSFRGASGMPSLNPEESAFERHWFRPSVSRIRLRIVGWCFFDSSIVFGKYK
jgi:hypothetical protein